MAGKALSSCLRNSEFEVKPQQTPVCLDRMVGLRNSEFEVKPQLMAAPDLDNSRLRNSEFEVKPQQVFH